MKLTILLALVFIIPKAALANIKHAPPSFKTEGAKAIFVDFIKADYELNYNPVKKSLSAESTITFETFEEGMPVFDMVENPTVFLIDGEIVATKVINSIDKDTWFRIALKKLRPGIHTFHVSSPINQGVSFLSNGVSSAFWLNDLGDRAFLEAYLPSNFEYDQYKITFFIDFKTLSNQKIFSNGLVTKLADNKFTIEFPETYNSSALYYHTAPIGRFPEKSFTFTSINGKDIPGVVYSKDTFTDLESVKNKIITIIQNLESHYGPWLHDKIIVHIAGNGGGMEYAGATMTDLGVLAHELIHSYFARGGFMPANGNAGWIDEALTMWVDSGMYTTTNLNGVAANMAGQSPYRRYTDNRAYSIGTTFMSYLNFRYDAHGGLNTFLNSVIQTSSFTPMTTEEFSSKLSTFYSDDVSALFKDHIYKDKKILPGEAQERPVHMKMTIAEMAQFL